MKRVEGRGVAIREGFESPLPHQPSLTLAHLRELRLASHAKVVAPKPRSGDGGPQSSDRAHTSRKATHPCNTCVSFGWQALAISGEPDSARAQKPDDKLGGDEHNPPYGRRSPSGWRSEERRVG